MRSLQEVLAELLEEVWNIPNPRVSKSIIKDNGDHLGLSYSRQQMAQWDVSDEEWEDMDYNILAEEVLVALGISNTTGNFIIL